MSFGHTVYSYFYVLVCRIPLSTNHLIVVVGAPEATKALGGDRGTTPLMDAPGDVLIRGHSTANSTRN